MDSPEIEEEFKRLPAELKHLILNESIGTRPFNQLEISHLLYIRRNIAIMWERYGKSEVSMLSSNLDPDEDYLKETNVFNVDITNEKNVEVKIGRRRDEVISALGAIEYLDGRFDTKIIEDTEYIIGYDEVGNDIYANMAVLDLKSIFVILRKRFNEIIPEKAIQLARKYTRNALDNIMDDMNGIRLFSLMTYLLCNATMLDIHVDILEHEGRYYEVRNNYLAEISSICDDLYEKIIIVVNNMI